MGYYNDDGQWMEGAAPPAQPRRMPRQMRPASERQTDPNEGVRRQARRELRQDRYDDDGNRVAGEPANTQETLEDLPPSGVAGLQRFLAGLYGTPRELSDAFSGWVAANTEEGSDLHERAERTRHDENSLPGYQENLDRLAEDFGTIHEPETRAGRYARTAGEFLPNALSPGGVVRRVASVAAPAAASEGAGEFFEGTDAEPWARLAAALAAHGVTQTSINVLTRQGLTADERAVRLISRELQDAGYSPDEIVRVANRLRQQAPTEELIGELMGPSGQRLMRATAAMGRGSGRSIADEALSARAEGRYTARGATQTSSIRDRVQDEAVRMTAPQQTRSPRNYWDALDALRTARANQGRDAYRAAHDVVPDAEAVNSQLIPYMRDAPREAFGSAVRQLETEAARVRARLATANMNNAPEATRNALMAELDDILTGRQQLNLFAGGQVPNTVNSRAIDYFQRGLLQMERAAGRGSPESGALSEARRAYNEMADRINPAFADARSRYGDSIRIEEIMDDGRRVFEMPEGEIDRLMRGAGGRGLSREEFDGFMLGVLDAIERRLGQSDTGFLARLTRNQNWRSQLEASVGGAPQARRFLTRLARETNMQQTRNFVQSGSRTEPLKEDIRALTEGEAELGFMADNEVRGTIIAAGRMATKNPIDAAWRLATWIYDRSRRPGIANPQVQEAMARRLFTTATREGAQELRDAIYALRNDPRADPAMRQWLSRVVSAESAAGHELDDESGSLTDEYRALRQAVDGPVEGQAE